MRNVQWWYLANPDGSPTQPGYGVCGRIDQFIVYPNKQDAEEAAKYVGAGRGIVCWPRLLSEFSPTPDAEGAEGE